MADLSLDYVVKIDGLSEIDQALKVLPEKIASDVVLYALADATEVLRSAIEDTAIVRSGALQASVASKTERGSRTAAYSVIGFLYFGLTAARGRNGKAPSTEDPGVYWRWVEFGRPGAGGNTHQAAQPFIRPAFDMRVEAAIKRFADSAAERLDQAIDQVKAPPVAA